MGGNIKFCSSSNFLISLWLIDVYLGSGGISIAETSNIFTFFSKFSIESVEI